MLISLDSVLQFYSDRLVLSFMRVALPVTALGDPQLAILCEFVCSEDESSGWIDSTYY